ncbi:DUF1127 domain-containing protein [Roseibacterium beibuensis]|uniref:DUF1127 domain-containing protein n=1 Tax=[Roseibacterium] beibuensis TaxID=1193142 RepID=A0ABP9KWE5_9RHOB|nr:DUF1127 domain-containing protein [Roseibacterium beibuensis]MCS6621892.1 DUF1127 domain-containing protein [Roseibacterium beibuensis]
MAFVSSNRSNVALGSRLGEIWQQASEAYATWRLYRRTLAELQGLSGRELADLGLNRSILRRAALEAAYGKDV